MNTQSQFWTVAQARPDERVAFIRRTYLHLAGAIALFVGLEVVLIRSPLAGVMLNLIARNRYGWLMILGAFILAGWLARSLAANVKSVVAQYAGLVIYTVAEAIIFIPLLYLAIYFSSPDVLPSAAS